MGAGEGALVQVGRPVVQHGSISEEKDVTYLPGFKNHEQNEFYVSKLQ